MIFRQDDVELPAYLIEGGLQLGMGNAKALPQRCSGSEEMPACYEFVIDGDDQPSRHSSRAAGGPRSMYRAAGRQVAVEHPLGLAGHRDGRIRHSIREAPLIVIPAYDADELLFNHGSFQPVDR
jgi:hypothetical protein